MNHDYRDVLLKASELVAEEGRWTQGDYFKSARNGQSMCLESVLKRGRQDEVKVCAVGALRLSAALLGLKQPDVERAFDTLRMKLGDEVSVWNDTEGRTADEVAEALRRAAE